MSLKEQLLRVIEGVITKVDDRIAGDGGARVKLTPEQQERMQKDLKMIRQAGDLGQPHRE